MAHHGSTTATHNRGTHSMEKARHKKEAAAAIAPSNVIPFSAWHIPVPTLTDSNALDCACDIIAIGGNAATTVFAAEFDYEKEMADISMDILSTLQSSLDGSNQAPDAQPETTDDLFMHQTAKMLEQFEAFYTANLRLAKRVCDSNMTALEALVALPRHFFGIK